MALLHTPEKDKQFQLIDFKLKGTDGNAWRLDDIRGDKGTLILFVCNHCPYVKAVIARLVEDVKILQQNGIGVAAIMPNDTARYPADSFENMKVFARENGFTFPYLIDEMQAIARAYGAVCTPDIFGFNAAGELQYRGRVDSAGPGEAGPDTRRELREAMLEIAQTGKGPPQQSPSMGCSIKWRN